METPLAVMWFLLVGVPLSLLVGAMIGSWRGRVVRGMLLSLLGPLGWLLAFLGPDQRSKCPYCREAVKDDAIVCKHCGRAIKLTAEERRRQDEEIRRRTDPVAAWEREQAILEGKWPPPQQED